MEAKQKKITLLLRCFNSLYKTSKEEKECDFFFCRKEKDGKITYKMMCTYEGG